MKLHRSTAGLAFLLACSLLALLSPPLLAQKSELKQPPPLDPAEGRREARKLIDNLLEIRPTENVSDTLLFRITDADDKETQVPVRFEIICTATNFLNVHETIRPGGSTPGMKLTIAHNGTGPSEYWLSQPPNAPARKLTPQDLSLPFAGSDFSVGDLGLEFLHWPEQRVVRNQMRRYVFCHMLESVNLHPGPHGYSRVVSWIGANRPDELVLVHADAYDSRGKLLKQFDPKKLERVHGVQELEEMEMRNRQTGTRTRVEFNVERK